MIGRHGRIARALRTLVRASSARDGRRVLVEIADPDGMKVAALYDVHAMPWALEAVLAEVDDERIDTIVFGGDYLYGPYPRETVAMIRALDARGAARQLRGPRRGVGARASSAPGDLAWLQSLPLAAIVDDVLYCHATPDDNTPITTAITPDEAVLATFGDTRGTVVIGHTHHQFDRRSTSCA